MNPRFKINLIGLSVALSFVLVGFGLGEPPRLASADPLLQSIGQTPLEIGPTVSAEAASASRGALMRHLAMPYVSFASLTPRRES
jgi:hypothetical protein